MEKRFSGRVWLMRKDIDTDIIAPTQILGLPMEEMIKHIFEPLYPDLAAQIQQGDIIVAGPNFGCGSSREMAPEAMKVAGIRCVIAPSFARIFFRNSYNNGMLLLENDELYKHVQNGDHVTVDLEKLCVEFDGKEYPIPKIPDNLLEIVEAGGLVKACEQENEAKARGEAKEKKPLPPEPDYVGEHTLAEKILMRNTHSASLRPGDIVMAQPTRLFVLDVYTGPVLRKLRGMHYTEVAHPETAGVIDDHQMPCVMFDDPESFRSGCTLVDEYHFGTHIIGEGIGHQLIPERRYAKPGNVIFVTDSHTTTYGAVGCFSTGVGYTEMAAALGRGEMWVRVPSAIKIQIDGVLPEGVMSKDIILRVLGDLTANGGTYRSLEFCGTAVDAMSMDARICISNMAVECGAKVGLFAPDAKTCAYSGVDPEDVAWMTIGPDECYEQVLHYKAEDFVPNLAVPQFVDNVHPVTEYIGTPVNQIFLGSCTNGRLEDMAMAAKILKGHHVPANVKFLVTCATKEIYKKCIELGYMQIFAEAGAMVTMPYCSLCQGRGGGVVGEDEVILATNNRNFLGRMGPASSKIYLGSPATIAASALTGRITDPRPILKELEG